MSASQGMTMGRHNWIKEARFRVTNIEAEQCSGKGKSIQEITVASNGMAYQLRLVHNGSRVTLFQNAVAFCTSK